MHFDHCATRMDFPLIEQETEILKKNKFFFLVYLQIGAWAAGSGRNGLGAGRIPNLMKCCWVPVFWNADEASGTHATPRRRRINAGPLIACHLSLISKKKEKKRY